MKIESKLNVGDSVWLMQNNKISMGTIESINSATFRDFETGNIMTRFTCLLKEKKPRTYLQYTLDGLRLNLHPWDFLEQDLGKTVFFTKQELINSLEHE